MANVALVFEFQIDISHHKVRVRVRGRIKGSVMVGIRVGVRVKIWVICGAIHRWEVYRLEQYLPSQIICGDLWCLGRPNVT